MAKFDPKVADAFLLANGLKYETVCILTLKLFRVVVNNLHICSSILQDKSLEN